MEPRHLGSKAAVVVVLDHPQPQMRMEVLALATMAPSTAVVEAVVDTLAMLEARVVAAEAAMDRQIRQARQTELRIVVVAVVASVDTKRSNTAALAGQVSASSVILTRNFTLQ